MNAPAPLPAPIVNLFDDGALGIVLAGQAMHMNTHQADILVAALRARCRPDDANSHQVGGDHYRALTIQVWDAIEAWGLGFLDGNVVKYVARYRRKGGLEDLFKAKHYLDKLIESVNGGAP